MRTSASSISRSARTVSSSGSPGPVPTNATPPAWRWPRWRLDLAAVGVAVLASRHALCTSVDPAVGSVLGSGVSVERSGAGRRRRRAAPARAAPPGRRRRRGRSGGPRRSVVRRAQPSSDSTTARSHSSGPSSPSATSASAPIGAEQPPSRVASAVRSASDGGMGRGVVERGEEAHQRVVGAALDGERALTGRGQHLERVEHLAHLVQPPDPRQSCPRQHHRVNLSCPHLADPGIDVATDGDHVQTEAEGMELRGPARRAGADLAARPGAHPG